MKGINMGIEQLLDRIATGLEDLVGLQSRMLGVAEQNQARLAGKYPDPVPPAVAEAEAEADAIADERKAREEEYNRLKAELVKRGVEIPPRTKLTTLQKLWEQHKDDAEEVAEAPVAEATPVVEEAPAEEAPAAPMTREEARVSIAAWYKGTPEDQKILVAAFAEVGATKFAEVKDEDFSRLLAIIDRLRGVAHA
jgi:hypothetical protein